MTALPDSTRLLLRHATAWNRGSLLAIDPPDAASAAALRAEVEAARLLIRDRAVWERLGDQRGAESLPWSGGEAVDVVLLYLPKGKELLEMSLAQASARLGNGGELLVAGGNREGIRSAPKRIEARFGNCTKVESAHHCTLYRAVHPGDDPAGDHRLEAWFREWDLMGERPLTIASLPGVFSHGRLDEGSRRLLEHLEPPGSGRVLDLGCGAGVLGAWIADRCPDCRVELVDSSVMAVAAAQRTLERNRLGNAHAYPSDIFSATSGRFDLIVTNPPFHSHVRTDYRFHGELVRGAAARLEKEGQLWLVVNRFLKLQEPLERAFGRVSLEFEDRRFRVYRAAAPYPAGE